MIIGVDIGGANLKFATVHQTGEAGSSQSQFFPMWTDSGRLSDALRIEFASLGKADAVAVTMTGEMADCFVDRRDGVRKIAEACSTAAKLSGIERLGFYSCQGLFVESDDVDAECESIASANWHASASWLASELSIANGMLIDIGSTTTDLILIKDEKVATHAKSDHERLCEGSLVYVGCKRTPICSVVNSLQIDGRLCPVMNEVFATIDDALLVLGMAQPNENDFQSADGQPRTRAMAANRIARMVGLDQQSMSMDFAKQLALQVVDAAKERINESFRLLDCSGTIVLGGHGVVLFEPPKERAVIRLCDRFDSQHSRCLPALAVASLMESLPFVNTVKAS